MSESPNIVAQTDERYEQHLAAMLVSLSENNPRQKLNVFLLVPVDRLDHIWGVVKQLAASLKFELLPIDRETVQDLSCLPHVGPATYYKFFIGDLIPKDISKILYLDCDMLVRTEIGDLWDQDVERCIVGATPDQYVNRPRLKIKQRLGLSEDALYFNAGLLLINLRRWREAAVGLEALRFAREHPTKLSFSDQCALNWVLRDNWMPLPYCWNVQTWAVTKFTWGIIKL